MRGARARGVDVRDLEMRQLRSGRAQIILKRAREQRAVGAVDDALEHAGAEAVGKAAENLTVHQRGVQQVAGIMDGDILVHSGSASARIDLYRGQIALEAVRQR